MKKIIVTSVAVAALLTSVQAETVPNMDMNKMADTATKLCMAGESRSHY